MGEIKFNIVGDASGFKKAVADAKAGVSDAKRQIESEGQAMSDVFDNLKKTIATTFTFAFAGQLAGQIAQVRGEFQQLEVAFKTMLGSAEKANALMSQLTTTAAITPFGLQDVANGAKQLLAFGMASNKVNETLIRLGDIAAGLSIPLTDLVYLYGTTMTQGRLFTQDFRQFQGRGIPIADELAKQFGVAKKAVGELVTAGKIGFPEVEKAIIAMTSEGGKFGGLMEAQSKTITGQISNIEDAIDSMFNEIGQSSEGLINGALSSVSFLIENYQTIAELLMVIAGAYGINKAALALNAGVANAMAVQEIEAYTALLGAKEANNISDAQTLASTKGMSVAKAEELLAVKALVKEKIAELGATHALALAKQNEANIAVASSAKQLASTEARMNLVRQQIAATYITNDAKKREALLTELNTLSEQRNALVKAQKTAQIQLETATIEVNSAQTALNTATTQANTIANSVNAKSVNMLSLAFGGLKKAWAGVTGFLSANPYLLLGLAIAGVAYSIYKVVTASNVYEAAQENMAKITEELNNKISEHKSKAEGYIRTIRDENAMTFERTKAYKDLQEIIPSITEQYSLQELQTLNNVDAQRMLNEEMQKMARGGLVEQVNKFSDSGDKMSEFWEGNSFWSFIKQTNAETPIWLNLIGSATGIFGKLTTSIIGASNAAEKFGKEMQEKAIDALRIFDEEAEEQAFLELDVETQIKVSKENEEKTAKEAKELKAKAEEAINSGDNTLFVDYYVQYQFKLKEKEKWEERLNNAMQAPTYDEQKKQWKVELAEKRKLLKEQSKDSSRATETDRETTRKEIQDLEKKLGVNKSGKSSGKSPEELKADYVKAQQALEGVKERQQKEQNRQIRDMYFRQQELEISLMDDASKRRIEEEKLNRQKEEYELQKEMEDAQEAEIARQKALFDAQEEEKAKAEAQKGKKYTKKVFADEDINNAELAKIADRYKTLGELTQQKADADARKAEADAMNEYLIEYGTYQEKRKAIADKYNKQIAEAETEGQKKILQKQMENELSELDISANKTTSIVAQLFGDMTDKSLADLRRLQTEGKKVLDFLTGGQWNEETGKDLGITKEMFNTISADPAKLAELQKILKDLTDDVKALENPFKQVKMGFGDMFKNLKDPKKFSEALNDVVSAMNKISQAGSFVSDSIRSLGNAFGSDTFGAIADGLDMALGAMDSAMQGAQAGAAFGPWGAAAGAAIGLVSSLGESIAELHDNKKEKKIVAFQEQIDGLQKRYDKLGDAIERAYSADASGLIEEQNKMLAKQRELISQQIAEEQDKKNADQSRINEWTDKMEEVSKQIEENKREAIEAMTGTDISSAIDSFATALADAWQNGTDSAYESVNVVKKLLRTGIVEYIKKTISPDVEALMGNMANYLGDGVISEYEQALLDAEAKAIANKSDQLLGTAKKAGLLTDEASSGTSGGASAMTQETAEEVNGRFTAMQISMEAMRTSTQVMQGALGGLIAQITPAIAVTTESSRTLGEIRDLAIQRNDYLADIAKYTKGNLAEVTSMAKEIVKIKDKL